MNPVEPSVIPEGSKRVVFAKDQPQYKKLPATISVDGVVITYWEPTAEELQALFIGGQVRIMIHTFNQPLQPIKVEVVEQECGYGE